MKRFVAKAVKAAGPRRKLLMRIYRAWSQSERALARRLAFADWMHWIEQRRTSRILLGRAS